MGLTRARRAAPSRSSASPAWGEDAAAARQAIGYAPQEVALDRFVPVGESLALHGRYFGMPQADATPSRRRDADGVRPVGEGRRLRPTTCRAGCGGGSCWRALLHRPRLVILDEPTAGVDLELRRDLWAYIRALHADGTTIL